MGINLSGILNVARNAITPLNEYLGAKSGAEAQANQQQISNAIRNAQLEREMQMAQMREMLMQKQADAADALARYRDATPGQYVQGDDGQYYWMPKRIGASTPSASGAAASGQSTAGAPPSLNPGLPVVSSSPSQGGSSVSPIPTGVNGPLRGGRAPRVVTGTTTPGSAPMLGTVAPDGTFNAMTTTAGDTVYGLPRANSRSQSGTQLNQALVNLRGQIANTQSQLAAAQRVVNTGNDPFATPATKATAANAATQVAALQSRLDSLQTVHDRLSAQQQRALGAGPLGLPLTPTTPQSTPSSGGPLDRATMQQMQDEFDSASRDLQSVLNSNAPDSVKAQARALYNQHQAEIAQKYGVIGQP